MEPHFHQGIEEQGNNERTILDYLNEDCWNAVLNYVPTQDILCVRIEIVWCGHRRNRWQLAISHKCYSSFKCWTYKQGSSVVTFETFGDVDDDMGTLRQNCRNVEVIKLMFLEKPLPPKITGEHFHHLKQLCIENCSEVTDDCLSQFLETHALEELHMLSNGRVTGKCLMHLNLSKLKCLVFRTCSRVKLTPLLSSADHLGGLKKLVLARSRCAISEKVHLLIDKLPKLEYLTVLCILDEDRRQSDVFFESVCRLKNLKHLHSSFITWDQHLEAVTRCCKQLEVFRSHCRYVTGRGVSAVCRDAGARLVAIDLGSSEVKEEDVVALVYACPNLQWLRVSFCEMSDVELGTRVAAARREMRASTRLHLAMENCYGRNGGFGHIFNYENELEDVLEIYLRDDAFDSDGVEDLYGDDTDPSDSD